MHFSKKVSNKIKKYHSEGALDQTAIFFLALCGVNHPLVREHVERVALLAEVVALKLKKDAQAAFYAGILHDVGKLIFSHHLFSGRDITNEEYEEVKKHALASFEILKQSHYLFMAFIAGLHHAMYERGYGLMTKDFPREWSPQTTKKALELSVIIAVCDDVDAALHRKTKIKCETGKTRINLKERLYKKFPDDLEIVKTALKEVQKI